MKVCFAMKYATFVSTPRCNSVFVPMLLRVKTNQVYRRYKRVRVKRDAAEVGRKGPEFVDTLQGANCIGDCFLA